MGSGADHFRVLHLDSGREMRGGQWQVLLLMEELARRGAEQTLLARQGAPLSIAATAAGFELAPWNVPAVRDFRTRADLVHAHDARSHTVAALFGGRPLVVSRRVAFPVGRSPFSVWKYRRPRVFLAVSEFVKKQLIAGGIAEE